MLIIINSTHEQTQRSHLIAEKIRPFKLSYSHHVHLVNLLDEYEVVSKVSHRKNRFAYKMVTYTHTHAHTKR